MTYYIEKQVKLSACSEVVEETFVWIHHSDPVATVHIEKNNFF